MYQQCLTSQDLVWHSMYASLKVVQSQIYLQIEILKSFIAPDALSLAHYQTILMKLWLLCTFILSVLCLLCKQWEQSAMQLPYIGHKIQIYYFLRQEHICFWSARSPVLTQFINEYILLKTLYIRCTFILPNMKQYIIIQAQMLAHETSNYIYRFWGCNLYFVIGFAPHKSFCLSCHCLERP